MCSNACVWTIGTSSRPSGYDLMDVAIVTQCRSERTGHYRFVWRLAATFFNDIVHLSSMSKKPEERTKDSGKSAKDNIEQPEPLGKEDSTEPVTVGSGGGASGREGKASGGAAGL